jgi:hypothetical protein
MEREGVDIFSWEHRGCGGVGERRVALLEGWEHLYWAVFWSGINIATFVPSGEARARTRGCTSLVLFFLSRQRYNYALM